MRHRSLPLAGLCALAFALAAAGPWAQGQVTQVQKLPPGAGAIGKGPDALVLKGYEDVPRPPAFSEAKRAEVAEQEKAVDNYTPQPAWAGAVQFDRVGSVAIIEIERSEFDSRSLNCCSRLWELPHLPDNDFR